MSPADIIDRSDLVTTYKISKAWIKEHGRLSGGVGKPMTWLRLDFEAYYYAWRDREKARHQRHKAEAAKISSQLDYVVRSIYAPQQSRRTAPTKMRGNGGRQIAS